MPRYRARGDMKGMDWPVTRAEVFQGWLQKILTPQQIDGFDRNQARHNLTIEDPVEFVHESRKSLIRHREVGLHTLKLTKP